ncbi:hypothetical protein STEPF1_04369 [Streptomyces sp. F-1]|nr:hypothetical protein STEPF1_04369 [Streptomyces sp. F-1]
MIDLRSALDDERLTVRDVLEDWDALLPRLRELAAGGGAGREPLAGPAVHAPVEPRQVFQSGADYRRHVVDLHVAHRAPGDDRPESERRAEAAEIMDRRAAEDLPYVFIGLPTSITGPYDDVVLPAWAEKPDWELELAAVIGRPAHRVSVEEALEYGLTRTDLAYGGPAYIAGYCPTSETTLYAYVVEANRDRAGIPPESYAAEMRRLTRPRPRRLHRPARLIPLRPEGAAIPVMP